MAALVAGDTRGCFTAVQVHAPLSCDLGFRSQVTKAFGARVAAGSCGGGGSPAPTDRTAPRDPVVAPPLATQETRPLKEMPGSGAAVSGRKLCLSFLLLPHWLPERIFHIRPTPCPHPSRLREFCPMMGPRAPPQETPWVGYSSRVGCAALPSCVRPESGREEWVGSDRLDQPPLPGSPAFP